MASEVCCLIQDVNLNDPSEGAYDALKGGFGGSKADGDLLAKPVMISIKNSSQMQQPSDIDYDIMKGKRVLEWEDRTDIESDSDSDIDLYAQPNRVQLTDEELREKYGPELDDMIRRRRILLEEKALNEEKKLNDQKQEYNSSTDDDIDYNDVDLTLLVLDPSDPECDETSEQLEEEEKHVNAARILV